MYCISVQCFEIQYLMSVNIHLCLLIWTKDHYPLQVASPSQNQTLTSDGYNRPMGWGHRHPSQTPLGRKACPCGSPYRCVKWKSALFWCINHCHPPLLTAQLYVTFSSTRASLLSPAPVSHSKELALALPLLLIWDTDVCFGIHTSGSWQCCIPTPEPLFSSCLAPSLWGTMSTFPQHIYALFI